MNRYLCIAVTFLDPWFHGRGDDEPEWPPSPMRLFAALVAGSKTGSRIHGWSDTKGNAFRWLAQREPPLIIAPQAQRGEVTGARKQLRQFSGYRFYVPNNDSDKRFERSERLTTKVSQPHRLFDGNNIFYLWPLQEGEWSQVQTHAQILCGEARHLLVLGWGIDQVVGNGRILTQVEASALQGRRWHAWKTPRPGSVKLRIPRAESLDDLERVNESFLKRVRSNEYFPPLKFSAFDTVDYMSGQTLPRRLCAVFELPDGIAFRQEDAIKIASMLRSVACRRAQTDTHQFPGGTEIYVAGHVGQLETNVPRFSYLPLPSIGHEHADGMIRRLVVAEPFGGDGSHAGWARQRLRNTIITDENGNERGVLLEPWRRSSVAVVGAYINESDTWSTVTPVVLPGYDDGKQRKAEKLALSAAEQAGLAVSAIVSLTLQKAPFWRASQHPRQYAVPSYLKRLPGWHIRIDFREPIFGPLAIGAGRHAGLGLFAQGSV